MMCQSSATCTGPPISPGPMVEHHLFQFREQHLALLHPANLAEVLLRVGRNRVPLRRLEERHLARLDAALDVLRLVLARQHHHLHAAELGHRDAVALVLEERLEIFVAGLVLRREIGAVEVDQAGLAELVQTPLEHRIQFEPGGLRVVRQQADIDLLLQRAEPGIDDHVREEVR